MMAETASLASRTVVKSASMVRTLSGIRSSRHVRSRWRSQHPLAPDEQAYRSGSQGLRPSPNPTPGGGAVGEAPTPPNFRPSVVGGDAVLVGSGDPESVLQRVCLPPCRQPDSRGPERNAVPAAKLASGKTWEIDDERLLL